MNTFSKFLVACSVFLLAACDSDNNNNRGNQPAVEFATVQVFHGVSDAPTVNVIIDGATALSGVDFLQSSNFISVEAGAHTIQVDALLPNGATATVIPETAVTLAADTIYLVSAIGSAAAGSVEASIVTQSDAPVTAGSARVVVLHATPGPVGPDFSLPVDVFVTAPGGALDTPLPFDYRGTLTPDPIELAADDYQIRVFLSGSTDAGDLVFDSGTIPLGDGDDLRLVAVPNTSGGPAALSLAAATPSGSVTILDVNTPTGLRLGHLSPDAGPVDVYANGAIYAGGVPYPTVTGFAPLPAGTYTVSVAPEGTMNDVIGPVDLPFDAGTLNSVLVVDTLDTILNDPDYLPIILRDDARPYATNARVRVIHGAPGAPTVDVYVVPVDPMMETDITNVEPTLPGFNFRDVTEYLSLAEGDYDVIVTGVGSKDPVIGPKTISIANGGVYTAIARQPGDNVMDFDVIVLADVLNNDT